MTPAPKGTIVVGRDMAIRGAVRNCREIEVYGYVEGEIAAQSVIIREGGRVFGKIRAGSAEVHGILQGTAFVKDLMTIRNGGSVSGNVQYGQLAMEIGGDLSADVRNVPPAIFGDLDLTVARGQAVKITVADLTAVDPDDSSASLTYTVSTALNGLIEQAAAPNQAVATFTQSDLEAGNIAFRHDGSTARVASFNVVVTDHAGASSGAPATVHVTVR